MKCFVAHVRWIWKKGEDRSNAVFYPKNRLKRGVA
jgi:hypothetical protein